MATILIVDDIAANRKFLDTVLTHQGHHLLEASDGSQALLSVAAQRPDLIITDVLMPVMDGYEFVKQLRLDKATRRIPVIFATAHYGEREARALALSSGVAWVVTKPIASAEINDIVTRVLAGESETGMPPKTSPIVHGFDHEHLRLVTDKLSEKTGDLREANARLRAMINIGLELASERDSDRLLQNVCVAGRELFGATYVTLGILDLPGRTVRRFVTCGTETAHWIKAGDSVTGILATVIGERRAIRGDYPLTDPSSQNWAPCHPDIQSFLAAPVASPDQVYGWICLVGNEGRAFTEDDEQLVMALSGQVGRIYENGYFASVARKRADQMEIEVGERKLAESALRLERDRAQRYLDSADVMLLALDMNCCITLVNRYACSILGWRPDELLGRDWIDTCLSPHIRVPMREMFQRLLAGDMPTGLNTVLTRAGEERLIEWRNTMLRDTDGQITGALCCGTDVTERNQAARALRTTEERMRFALEAAGVGIWDMNYTTGINTWSETLEAQYGLKPGTFNGTLEAFNALIHPDDSPGLFRTIGNAMKSGSDFSVQHRAVWPDGTIHWLHGAGRVHLGAQGEPARAVGISLDVTDRLALEAQYQQAQKMEAVGQLAGGVAHDFNNLLTAILVNCELLLADMHPDDPHQSGIAEIQTAGLSAADLTRQLLAFSRKQVIEPTLFDLNALVTDMRTLLMRLIGDDVKVMLGLRPELSPVRADHGQVEQIVMNLALNARDAMPNGGTLSIETANVELGEQYPAAHQALAPGPYVILTVSDTGTGMSPAVQSRLFEPFFTTKEPGKGTGLGLATVHGIVERSGGTISVRSEVGRGSTFTVFLPRVNGAELVASAPAPVVRRPVGTETILVVEDADALRKLSRRVLERLGYTVLVAASAGEALSLFDANAGIDVLLTDVVMPGASGPELTKQLVGRKPGLKVIYMSGYAEDAIAEHGSLSPGIAFLHKPFNADTLGRKIREVLDR